MSFSFCPNISLPENKQRIKEIGLKNFYQEFYENNFSNYDKEEKSKLFGTSEVGDPQFHINTLNVVNNFLEKVGVGTRFIDEFLGQDGIPIENAIAAANFISGTVDIIDNLDKRPAAWNKLPEEAAHFWYRLLAQDSGLKNQLWNATKDTELFKQLQKDNYGNYNSADTLKEEAIGQLIAQSIDRIATKNANPKEYSFFKNFVNWINGLIKSFMSYDENPYDVAAIKILNNDTSDLMHFDDYKKLINSVEFDSQLSDEAILNEHNYNQVIDGTEFYQKLINGQYKQKSRYLKKTIDKYINDPLKEIQKRLNPNYIYDNNSNDDYRDTQINSVSDDSYKIHSLRSQSDVKLKDKLTKDQKNILKNTNNYTNLTPSLKGLTNLSKKYSNQNIAFNQDIKLDGVKKEEISVYNSVLNMIKSENPGLKSIKGSEFVNEIHNYLEANYALGFADEQNYLGYRIDQTFEHVSDRVSNRDLDMGEVEANPNAFNMNDVANTVGLRKENPDVYHRKISMRFNDEYFKAGSHFPMSPSAWGNLTYFYSRSNSAQKDAVLLHEIQNDHIERLRKFASKEHLNMSNVDSINQVINDILNRTNLEYHGKKQSLLDSNGKEISTKKLNDEAFKPLEPSYGHTLSANYYATLINKLGDLGQSFSLLYDTADYLISDEDVRRGYNNTIERANETINLYNSDSRRDYNRSLTQKNLDGLFSLRRKYNILSQRSESLLSEEDLNILSQRIAHYNNIYRNTGISYIKEGFKRDFEVRQINNKFNAKIGELYPELANGLGTLSTVNFIPYATRKKDKINSSAKFLLKSSIAIKINEINKQILYSKKTRLGEIKQDNAFKQAEKIKTLSLDQYKDLYIRFKSNLEHFDSTIKSALETPNKILEVAKEKAIEELKNSANTLKDNTKRLEILQSNYEVNIKKLEDAREELLKNSIEDTNKEDVNSMLERELNYFTPLVHQLLQTHIQEKGKDFPMYFSGKEITMLTQGSQRSSDIYAGPEEVKKGLADKVGSMWTAMNKVDGIKLEYQDQIPGFNGGAGGYKVNLDNYQHKSPILYGIQKSNDNINKDPNKSVMDKLFVDIDKFSDSQQREIVDSIIYQIEEGKKQGITGVEDLFKYVRQVFTNTRINEFESDNSDGSLDGHIQKFHDIDENWDRFKDKVIEKVKGIGMKITKVFDDTASQVIQEDSDTPDLNEIESNSPQDNFVSTESTYQRNNFVDEWSQSISSKDTASAHLKLKLSLIPENEIEDGELVPATNFLGLPKFMDLNKVWTTLQGVLTGLQPYEIYPTISDLAASNPMFATVLETIQGDKNTATQNEFVVAFTKNQSKPLTAKIGNAKNGQRTLNIFDTNRLGSDNILISNWYDNFKKSSYVKTDSNGDLVVDTERAKLAIEGFNKLMDKFDPKDPKLSIKIQNGFSGIGINLTLETINNLIAKGTKIDGTYYNAQEFLNKYVGLLFKRVAGGFGVNEEEDEDNKLSFNNPFISEPTTLKALAKLENTTNPFLYEASYTGGDGKARFGITNNSYISKLSNKLNNPVLGLQVMGDVLSTTYGATSVWATKYKNDPKFRQDFQVFHNFDSLGTAESKVPNKSFKDMSTKEKEFTRMIFFQNKGNNTSYFFGPTPSDKTTLPIVKAPRIKVKLNNPNTLEVRNSEVVEAMYNVFITEYNRIKDVQSQKVDPKFTDRLIEGYHYVTDNNGAKLRGRGEDFMIYDIFNGDKDLFDEKGQLRLVDAKTLERVVSPKIAQYQKDLIKNQLKYWAKLEIAPEMMFDKGYRTSLGDIESDSIAIRTLAADYAINNFIAYFNYTQVISGDPALHGKSNIEKTWINYSKRLAKDIAPGLDGNFTNPKYTTVFLKDLNYSSKHLNEYMEVLGKVGKAYKNMNPADAQEYTTLEEHLNVLRAYGKLSPELEEAGKRLLEGGESSEDIDLILQPMKPVYVGTMVDKSMGVNKMYYIKTSSFPLIPSITRGLEIDKLRVAMETAKTPVNRAVYESGVKLGLSGDITSTEVERGVIDDKLDFSGKVITLDRDGFRIQQEIPFHGDGTHINEGSQGDKLIMVDVDDDKLINLFGHSITGKDAKTLFSGIHVEKMDRAFNKLIKDIGAEKDGNGNLRIKDLSKLQQILLDEATSRNYNINDIYGLELENTDRGQRFKIPLGFNNSSNRLESIMNSLFTNRVIKSELPGFAKVQGSGAGFSKISTIDKLNSQIKDSIIWINPADTELNYIRKSSDNQIIWGHPGIGKTSLKETNKDIIDFDTDYKSKINEKYNLESGYKARNNWRESNKELWDKEIRDLWKQAKDEAKKSNKSLLASDMLLLRESHRDFDKVLTMPVDKFIERAKQRNDYNQGETELWKSNLDKEISKIDSSKVMLTDKYLSQVLSDILNSKPKKLLQADILLPSWFHEANLQDFIKEDGTLDLDKLPEELLTVIGLRIPTQGLNSMMSFRVKGFLPKMVGDLAIVPPEIVVQMGSDFDVDKMFMYRYHHEFDGTKFTKVKPDVKVNSEVDENGELRTNLKDNNLKKYSDEQLDNAIIQFYEDRYKDPDLLDKILQPNGFGDLEDIKREVIYLQELPKVGNFFTTEAQNLIHKNNNDGKSGTGIFSLFSTFIRAAQDAKLYLPEPISFKVDGRVVNARSLFGTGYTEGKTPSMVISYFQSASVDNSKEQILGVLNINGQTMDVAGTIALAGFDEKYISYFLSQPIIREYVEKLSNLNDITNTDFNSNKEIQVVDNLANDKYKLSSEEQSELSKYIESEIKDERFIYSTDDMRKELESYTPLNQRVLLEQFLAIKDQAKYIRKIQNAINTNTSGLGVRYVDLQVKSINIDLVRYNENWPNINRLFEGNQIGKGAEIVNQALQLFSKILPYNTKDYVGTVDRIIEGMGKANRAELYTTDLNLIYKHLKSYIYSSKALLGIEDANIERNRLLYGSEALGNRWDAYKNTPAGKKNLLSERINVRRGTKDSDPIRLEALNTPAANTSDNNDAMTSFYRMYHRGTELEKALAIDLVRYHVLTGAQQGPGSIAKYIPYDILEEHQFSNKLHEMDDLMRSGSTLLNNAVEQFFQHNPSKAIPFDTKSPDISDYKSGGFFMKSDSQYLVPNEKNDLIPSSYMSVYSKEAKVFYLYKLAKSTTEGHQYSRIDTLGDSFISEYNADKEGQYSIIKANQANQAIPETTSKRVVESKDQSLPTKEVDKPNNPTLVNEDYIKDKLQLNNSSVESTLNSIIELNNKEYDPELSNIAKDYKRILVNYPDITIDTNLDRDNVSGQYLDKNISLNLKNILATSNNPLEAAQRTILHEISHAITAEKIENYENLSDKDKNSVDNIKKLFIQYRRSVNNDELYRFEQLTNKIKSKESISEEDTNWYIQNKSKYYALTNVHDFIAAGLTDMSFVQELKNNNFWNKLWKFVSELLGLNESYKNDYDALYNTVLDLGGRDKSSNSSSTPLEDINLTPKDQKKEFLERYHLYDGKPMTVNSFDRIKATLARNSKYSNIKIDLVWEHGNRVLRVFNKNGNALYDIDPTPSPEKNMEEKTVEKILKHYYDIRNRIISNPNYSRNIAAQAKVGSINKEIKQIKDDNTVTIATIKAKERLGSIESLMNRNGLMSALDITESKNFIDFYANFKKIVDYNEEFEEEVKTVDSIVNKAISLSKILDQKKLETFINYANQTINLGISLSELYATPNIEVGNMESNFQSGMYSTSQKLQVMESIIRNAKLKMADDFNKYQDSIYPIFNEFQKKYGNYDSMLQLDKDGKKNGQLLNKYSDAYYQELKKRKGKGKEFSKFFRDNTDIKITERDKEAFEDDLEELKESLPEWDVEGTHDYAQYTQWYAAHDPKLYIAKIKRNGFIKKEEWDRYKRYVSQTPKDKWIDPRYTKLKSFGEDSVEWKVYSELEGQFRSMNKLYGNSANYIPETSKDVLDYIFKGDVTGAFDGLTKKMKDAISVKMVSQVNSNMLDIDGVPIDSIPVYMMSNIMKPEEKSMDLGRVLLAAKLQEAMLNHKNEIEPYLNFGKELIHSSPAYVLNQSGKPAIDEDGNPLVDHSIARTPRLNSQATFIPQSFLYDKGVTQSPATENPTFTRIYKNSKGEEITENRALSGSKVVDAAGNLARAKVLGLNPVSSVGRLIWGTISTIIYAGHRKSYGEREAMKSFKTMLKASIPGTEDYHKVEVLAKYFDMRVQIGELKFGKFKIGSIDNPLADKSIFMFVNKTEDFIQHHTGVAYLMKQKVTDLSGKSRDLFDAFDHKGEWNKEEFGNNPFDNNKNRLEIISKIQDTIQNVHGDYGGDIMANQNYMLRALLVMRKWLPLSMSTRFGKEYTDLYGDKQKGRYLSYLPYLKLWEVKDGQVNYMPLIKAMYKAFTTDESADTVDTRNLRMNAYELAFIPVLWGAALAMKMMLHGLYHDDDKEKATLTFLLNTTTRVSGDLTFFMNPYSFIETIREPIPALKTVQDMFDLFPAVVEQIEGKGTYKTGIHKGQNKLAVKTRKVIPLINQVDKAYSATHQLIEGK